MCENGCGQAETNIDVKAKKPKGGPAPSFTGGWSIALAGYLTTESGLNCALPAARMSAPREIQDSPSIVQTYPGFRSAHPGYVNITPAPGQPHPDMVASGNDDRPCMAPARHSRSIQT